MFGKQCKTAFEHLLATTHGFFGMAHVKAIVVALSARQKCEFYPSARPTPVLEPFMCFASIRTLLVPSELHCALGAGAAHAGRPACAVAQDARECRGQDHRGICHVFARTLTRICSTGCW